MTDIFSGGALSGGVPQEQEYVDRITDRWILPGDRRETDAEVRVPVVVSSAKGTAVAPDAAAKPAGNRDPAIVASRLAALFQSTGLPIVARLPDLQEDPGAAAGSDKPLSAFLDGLHQKQIRHKWHDGTLLVTHARWMKDEGTPSPYPPGLLRQLEAAVNSDPRGLMPLSGVCLALSQREAGVPLMPPPKEVTAWSDLLVPLAGNTALLTDLQSKQGADIGSLPLRALRRIRAAALRKNVPVTGQSRLRLTTTDEDKLPGFNHRRRILRIELLPDGGTGAAAAAQTLDTFTLVDREEAEPAKPVPPLAG